MSPGLSVGILVAGKQIFQGEFTDKKMAIAYHFALIFLHYVTNRDLNFVFS